MGCVSSGTGDRLGILESSERVAHGATRAQRGTSARWVERMATGREVLQQVLTPHPAHVFSCSPLQKLIHLQPVAGPARADTGHTGGFGRHGPYGRFGNATDRCAGRECGNGAKERGQRGARGKSAKAKMAHGSFDVAA